MPATFHTHSHRHGRSSSHRARRRFLLHVVDAGLAGCVFGLPWLLGGRHPLGELVLVALAVLAALAWLVRQALQTEAVWRWSAGVALVVVAVGLVALQLLPLPQSLLTFASSKTPQILPLWFGGDEAGVGLRAWSCVSLAPASTLSGLVLLGAYGLLFWVGVQRIEEIDDVERLLRWCGLSALAVAAFGIVQYLASNGRFFWFYEDPLCDTFDAAKAGFTNNGHFAHFVALGVGPFIWWVQDSLHKKHRRGEQGVEETFVSPGHDGGLRWLGLGVLLLAGLLSLSQGGVVAFLVAGAVTVAVCYREKRIGSQALLTLGVAALAVAVGIGIFGGQEAAPQTSDAATGGSDGPNAAVYRSAAWSTTLRAARDFPLLGAGVGSHPWVCPLYLDATEYPGFDESSGAVPFAHAASGPLQIALETGLPGVGLLAVGVAYIGFWCCRSLGRAESRRARLAAAAASAAVAASLLQGCTGSVWYVPSCMALVVILAACACRLSQLATPETVAAPRMRPSQSAAFAAAVVGVLGAAMVFQEVGPVRGAFPWLAYQRLLRIPPENDDPEQDATIAVLQKRVETLQKVVARDWGHAEAHLRLAGDCLRLFRRIQESWAPGAMTLADVRRAAANAPRSSPAEFQAWLAGTVGPHATLLELARQHARLGLAGCPLEGMGYLHLRELCFIEGRDSPRQERALVEQALRVRPLDGNVLIAAGHEAIQSGETARGVTFWKKAYRAGHVYRCALVRRLAGRVYPHDPARDVAFFLDTFQPGLPILRQLDAAYASKARGEDLVRLRSQHAQVARAATLTETGSAAARLWLEARTAHARLGDGPRAVECLERAAACQPDDYTIRCQLAVALAEQSRYGEAMEHVEWCLAKRPDDPALRNVARQITQAQARRAWSGLPAEEPMRYRR